MKIKSLQLKNFKRFTDLTLQDIPGNAKLVLLIGSNGSGKSSVFDAFERIAAERKEVLGTNNVNNQADSSYYAKNPKELYSITINDDKGRVLASGYRGNDIIGIDAFYGRSSNRYVPRLTKTTIGQTINIIGDEDRPKYYIDFDKRFENDIDVLIQEVIEKVFKGINADNQNGIEEIRRFLEKINLSFPKIFGTRNGTKLVFKSFIPPAEGKPSRLIFQKGNSIVDYDVLSAGEKEIVNLLFNLFVRREYYQNTIYFYDEIDLHLNTKLQYNFLKEITENWIPDNCQLWTASHSLGFIQYAKESDNAVIFDFDDYDFDYPRMLVPEPKDNAEIYNIAISKELLPELFKDFDIFFVENEDRRYYASLNIERTLFVPEKNRDGVFHKSKTAQFKGIVDRDFLTDDDIVVIEEQYPALKVLRYYCIENYLFHPGNLEEYFLSKNKGFDKQAYIESIFIEKEKIKAELLIKIASIRQGYPYFKEVGMEKLNNRKRFTPDNENYIQSGVIAKYLDSIEFEEYYKSFSMKDYAKNLIQRQNINPVELSKTQWFKSQIAALIK